MQGFSRQNLKKRDTNNNIKDLYDIDVQNMTKKTLAIQSKQFVQFAGKKQALQFIKRSYSIVALGFIVSAFSYPFSVRIVKKVLGLKNFFNIHFAIIPIMMNINALVLGSAQGYLNYLQVKKNYNINLSKQF